MYGGTGGKTGRAGGHSVKRSSFPPPPSNRPSAGRLSLGTSAAVARSAKASVDENFSLLPGRDPPAFAMIIRLTPDLVDEIGRIDAQGEAARIKFDPNVNNTSGNVIGVGGKDFRFTWSSEMGDLCDIYEERQSGEDGNGLLFESGCAWRKLNVQRILDESTTNQVKMRSEEAERKQKSRKAIVLEPGNPSMKNQTKMVAAAESNSWKTPFKQKKEPAFKNRKFELSQAGAPAKSSVYISGMSSASTAKGRQSASPLPPSSPDQSVAPASPVVNGNISKSHVIVDEIIPTPVVTKEKIITYEDEIPSRAASTTHGTPVSKGMLGAASVDLQSKLISLLIENPKGMNLKALVKAIGDAIPNSIKKIEPIIKKIATFQTPGRYVLKPGIEMESFKKPLSESGSPPEYNKHQRHASVDRPDQIPFSEPSIVEKILINEYNNELQLNSKSGEELAMLEKNDIQQMPPNPLDDKRATDNSRGQVASYSNSGSDKDSESDSSDSGSDTKSNSRSKSPVGSSSDSESDASSNSKEGSDVDVDIMSSDDDKEPKHKIKIKRNDGMPVQHEIDERQHDHEFSAIEIERILPHDQEAKISALTKEIENPKPYSSNHDDYQERQNLIVSLFDENENSDKDGSRHKHSDSSERFSKSNCKRAFDMKHGDERSQNTKRLKAGSLPQPPITGIKNAQFSEGVHDSSPDRIDGDTSNIHMINSGYMVDPTIFYQQDQRYVDHGSAAKALDMADKLSKDGEAVGYGPKYFERKSHTHGNFPMQEDKAYIEAQGAYINTNNKKVPKNIKEASFSGKHVLPCNSQHKKQSEIFNLNMESSPKDSDGNVIGRYPPVNGKSRLLQRELSDLELGELREPVPEENPGTRKQFEKKKYSKQSDGKSNVTDTHTIKGRPGGKANMDLERPSSPNLRTGAFSNTEAILKKRTPENHVEDKTRLPHKVTQSQPQHVIRADVAEVGIRTNNLADVNSKFRQSEFGTIQGIGLEGYKETQKKIPISEVKLHENKRGSRSKKENRAPPSIAVTDLTNGQKDATLLENNNYVQKRMESSSDENSCYSKYEKDKPELKGPIKDFSQYEEYVQEYRDKYESYCSLDKILEADRNQFLNMGKNLKFSEGRDMERYYNLVSQLKDSYQQYGPRNKRLKHIFVVLHEELKVLKQRIKDYALQYTKD